MSTKYFAVRFNDGRSEITQSQQRKEVLNNNPYEYCKIALAKGFNSYIDAVLWLQDPQHFPPRKQFFAVKTGRHPGLYYTQEDYDRNVRGYPSAEGMSFYTEKAAEDRRKIAEARKRMAEKYGDEYEEFLEDEEEQPEQKKPQSGKKKKNRNKNNSNNNKNNNSEKQSEEENTALEQSEEDSEETDSEK